MLCLFYHSKKKICSFRTGPHTPYKFHPPHSCDNLPDYQKPKGPLLQAPVSFTGRVGGLLWLVLSAEHCRLALAHADLFSSVWGTARHQERHLGAKHFTVSKPFSAGLQVSGGGAGPPRVRPHVQGFCKEGWRGDLRMDEAAPTHLVGQHLREGL